LFTLKASARMAASLATRQIAGLSELQCIGAAASGHGGRADVSG
jgi:hypothetical protein